MTRDLSPARIEYEANVWDHTVDAFQMNFDLRRPLDEEELAILTTLTARIGQGVDDEQLSRDIEQQVAGFGELLLILMQQAGLTRNKIITDLKGASSQLDLRVPGTPEGLLRSKPAWNLAGPYLSLRLRKVLEPLTVLADPRPALEAINQATYPHWIRQERAKRQGHEAEYRVAIMLDGLGIPFDPAEKSENPLCRDAQISGESYDIVVPSVRAPVLVMKSTVQTSNIGQFGESKAHLEITEAKASLLSAFVDPPKLVAMIDGVGFLTNIAGLNGVLENADEFCQFRTIWKAAAVAAWALDIGLHMALPEPSIAAQEDFLNRYGPRLHVHNATDELRAELPPTDTVDAGEAFLWLE